MMHIQRDERGEVIGLLQRPLTTEEASSGDWLEADPADPAVAAFARRVGEAGNQNPLALTDAELARVTEDLIDVLIDRAVIQFTDLPWPRRTSCCNAARPGPRWPTGSTCSAATTSSDPTGKKAPGRPPETSKIQQICTLVQW